MVTIKFNRSCPEIFNSGITEGKEVLKILQEQAPAVYSSVYASVTSSGIPGHIIDATNAATPAVHILAHAGHDAVQGVANGAEVAKNAIVSTATSHQDMANTAVQSLQGVSSEAQQVSATVISSAPVHEAVHGVSGLVSGGTHSATATATASQSADASANTVGSGGGSSSSGGGGSYGSSEVQQATSTIGDALGQAAGAVKSAAVSAYNAAPGAAGSVVSAANAVGSTVSSAVSGFDAGDLAQITSAAMNAIGLAAGVFPFLVPVQIALKDLGKAVQGAVFNRESSRLLTQRCADCSMMLHEMAPKLVQLTKDPSEQERLVAPVVAAINSCSDFLSKFTKKGFLFQVVSNSRDKNALSNLDKVVTDSLQNLSLRISGFQMQMQAADSNKLDEVFMLVQQSLGNNRDNQNSVAKIDPNVLAEIAMKAGCETTEALKNELEPFGVKLEEISQNILKLMSSMSKIDTKLDTVQEDLHEIRHTLSRAFDAANEKTDDMMDLLKTFQAEATQASSLTLAKMQEIALKNGAQIQEKFSTPSQSIKLAKRAEEMRSRGLNVLLIHCNGVGIDCYESISGAPGDSGAWGKSAKRAADGGQSSGLDGTDGKDGTRIYVVLS